MGPILDFRIIIVVVVTISSRISSVSTCSTVLPTCTLTMYYVEAGLAKGGRYVRALEYRHSIFGRAKIAWQGYAGLEPGQIRRSPEKSRSWSIHFFMGRHWLGPQTRDRSGDKKSLGIYRLQVALYCGNGGGGDRDVPMWAFPFRSLHAPCNHTIHWHE